MLNYVIVRLGVGGWICGCRVCRVSGFWVCHVGGCHCGDQDGEDEDLNLYITES